MCTIDETLKLCTCSDKIDRSQPHWRLSRKTIRQPEDKLGDTRFEMLGEIALSYAPRDSEPLLEQLNQRNCFDFDYQAMDNDKLDITLTNETLTFVFNGQANLWEPETMSFNHVRRSVQAKGTIENII